MFDAFHLSIAVAILPFLVCGILNGFYGKSRGQNFISCFILGFVLFMLGVIIVAAMPDLKKKNADEEKAAALEAERQRDREDAAELRRQLAALTGIRPAVVPVPPKAEITPPPAPKEEPNPSYHVAVNGVDIGEKPLATIKAMVDAKALTKTDVYFCPKGQKWEPLSNLS